MELKGKRLIELSEVNFYNGAGIYAIVNCHNGKMYIGSTKHVYRRLQEHDLQFRKKECNKKILADIEKGDVFNAIILYKVESHCIGNDLRIKEKEYILKYNAFASGYNSAYTTERNQEKGIVF